MFVLFPLDNEDHSMLIMYSNLFMPLFGTIRMTRLVQGFDCFTSRGEELSETDLAALLNKRTFRLLAKEGRNMVSPITFL